MHASNEIKSTVSSISPSPTHAQQRKAPLLTSMPAEDGLSHSATRVQQEKSAISTHSQSLPLTSSKKNPPLMSMISRKSKTEAVEAVRPRTSGVNLKPRFRHRCVLGEEGVGRERGGREVDLEDLSVTICRKRREGHIIRNTYMSVLNTQGHRHA